MAGGATSVEDFGNRTVMNQNFWTGTAADTVVGVGTGLAAAAIVGGTIVGLTALGVAAAATAPVWLVVGATALVGAAIGYGLSKAKVNDGVQNVFNNLVDTAQSWFD
ncbi:MAG TPA: hypothetical protein VHP14_12105 [Anaerolineales bacterium]|nr:hypothetical protein [Anaerolineales bacterium]